MGKKCGLPGPDTQASRLLSLTAISGEFPATLLNRLPGGESYRAAMVYRLKRDGLLHTHYRDGLRTYRLTPPAKSLLLSGYPGRFEFSLTGGGGTNRLKSEVTRRLRQCRIAAAHVAMLNAGVAVFRDGKPDIFRYGGVAPCRPGGAAFYSSREIKAIGSGAVKIRGASLVGVLLSRGHIFATYNNAATGRWDFRAEILLVMVMRMGYRRPGKEFHLLKQGHLRHFRVDGQKGDGRGT
jgi:hypothetical protein